MITAQESQEKEDRILKMAKAIYLKMDPQNADPWEEAMARSARYSGKLPPMIQSAFDYAEAALGAIE